MQRHYFEASNTINALNSSRMSFQSSHALCIYITMQNTYVYRHQQTSLVQELVLCKKLNAHVSLSVCPTSTFILVSTISNWEDTEKRILTM